MWGSCQGDAGNLHTLFSKSFLNLLVPLVSVIVLHFVSENQHVLAEGKIRKTWSINTV